ncbi:aureusimine biosynthesis 4'-phosphopantetheinyl transferase AusB [Staphylococcus caprae]
MTLFLTKINADIDMIAQRLLTSRRQAKKPRRIQYRFQKDRVMHTLGDFFIQYCIEQWGELSPNQWEYQIAKNGKVDIQSAHSIGLYVNLSYSFPYIACAIDDQPVGLDIELMKEIDYMSLAHQFSENEFKQVQILKDFYEIWTKKESYTKMIGEGLVRGIDVYDVTQPLFYKNKEVSFQPFVEYNMMIQLCTVRTKQHELVEIPIQNLY